MSKTGKSDPGEVPAGVMRFKPQIQSRGGYLSVAAADDSSTESEGGEGMLYASSSMDRERDRGGPALGAASSKKNAGPIYTTKRDSRPKPSSKKVADAVTSEIVPQEVTEVVSRQVIVHDGARTSSSQTRSLLAAEGSGEGDLRDDAGNFEQPPEWGARRLMLKELAAKYRAELISHCRELLTLQREWRSELPVSLPVAVSVQTPEAIMSTIKPVRAYVRKVKPKGPKDSVRVAPGGTVPSCNLLPGENAVQVEVQAKVPIRRRIAWRANEREALRRGLLSFGLNRADKVKSIMRSLLKELRHGIGDITDCCWEFLRCCGMHAESKEILEYAEKRYASARDIGLETGPEVSERVGNFEKTDKSSTLWLRRLRLLDSLAEVVHLCANKDTRDAAYRAIDSVKDASVPSEWWGREADLALLAGIYKHGFGNYDLVRNDEQFSDVFKSKAGGRSRGSKSRDPDNTNERGSSEDDLDTPLSGINQVSETSWPDAQVLTRRLKRLVDHISRSSQLPPKLPKGNASARSGEENPWSKRERLELIKLLMKWGVPMTPVVDEKIQWQFFREHTTSAPLRRRTDSSLEAGYQELMNDMQEHLEGQDATIDKSDAKRKKKSVAKGQKTGPESSGGESTPGKGMPVLTFKTAVRLKERLEILEVLRLGTETFPGDWHALGFLQHTNTQDLPAWWQAATDDKALTRGVLKHGVGNWDAIFSDSSLGFEVPVRTNQARSSDGEASEKEDDDEGTDDDDETKQRKAARMISGQTTLNIPSPTACIKRLKFTANILRRQLRKLKPKRSKRPTSEVKEVEVLREVAREVQRAPKRPKYTTLVQVEPEPIEMIERDDEGRPILPMRLSPRLTLLHLGVVEPDRPGFHTDQYIFPIGFTTERDYSSMVNPNEETTYTCMIIDGGRDGPLFRVTPADGPELTVQKESPTGVWMVVYAAVSRLKEGGRDRPNVNGIEMFGLSHPLVCKLIQELPDADNCMGFQSEAVEARYRREAVEAETPITKEKKKVKDRQHQSRSARKKKDEQIHKRPAPLKAEFDINADPDDTD